MNAMNLNDSGFKVNLKVKMVCDFFFFNATSLFVTHRLLAEINNNHYFDSNWFRKYDNVLIQRCLVISTQRIANAQFIKVMFCLIQRNEIVVNDLLPGGLFLSNSIATLSFTKCFILFFFDEIYIVNIYP